ncbi:MAG: hypothetical protein ABIJ97_10745 [Bacteroidota bacterium]
MNTMKKYCELLINQTKESGILIIFIIFCTNTFSVFAQDDDFNNSNTKLGMQLNYGIQLSEFSNMNSLLKKEGYPELSKAMYITGGGVVFESLKWITQADFIFSEQRNEENGKVTKYWVKSLSGTTGYKLISTEKYCFYPQVGISYKIFNIQTSTKITSQSASSYFSNSGNLNEIRSNQSHVQLGSQFNFLINKKGSNNNKFIIGLRGGYNFPILKNTWMVDSIKLTDEPKINSGGFYLCLSLGFI